MGFFGVSRKESFIRREAANLATYVKNNAVKLGGEAYAKCQMAGILDEEIDEALLWYFWTVIFAFRVAQDTLILKKSTDNETVRILLHAFVDVDNQCFSKITHAPYGETFATVNEAHAILEATAGKLPSEQVSMFMLHAIKSIPLRLTQEQGFAVVLHLVNAATSFPSLREIIQQSAE